MSVICEYLLFLGIVLYFAAGGLFAYLFTKTLKINDGNGLSFLRLLTLSLSFGSFAVFAIRVLSEYGPLDMITARAIAVINPTLLVVVALYLNYLFCNTYYTLTKNDSQNIKDIKVDVKENNTNIKIIKHDIVKKRG